MPSSSHLALDLKIDCDFDLCLGPPQERNKLFPSSKLALHRRSDARGPGRLPSHRALEFKDLGIETATYQIVTPSLRPRTRVKLRWNRPATHISTS
ncbi:uncharacterized protein L3040_009048 [Drepanopeziza brunnea f. sp. 'multigermtubi']|uniref:uncharacterized protein n=1 Tax=Drepanopeziza brunnea f. sp. 'multigermtubi' TaxID=698441 RepID=UPI00239B0DE0|nr:hypothetical protein L3040_009048 [Drepanopeziza brunnea f. sp. 'multigermtubi']